MNAQDLKNSILQRAIEGKLVPQRKEEGTAKELLAEIRAGKARLVKEKKIKKNKPLPEITDEEKPFDIPESWEWVRLGELGEWCSGATPSRQHPEYFGGEIPWLKTGDLNDGYIKEVPESITDEGFQHSSTKINPIGSVLIAMYGATIGRLGILQIPATTNQACCACELFSGIYNKYLFYFLLANRKNFIKQGAGGAQPNISKAKIIDTIIPLPPLAEQRRIVDKIEELQPDIDAYDKAQTKLQAIEQRFPDAMKKSLLQYAIEGKLVPQRKEEGTAKDLLAEIRAEKARLVKEKKIKKTKPLPNITDDEKPFAIPDSWEWVRMGDLLNIIGGTSYKNNQITTHGLRILRGGNINTPNISLYNDDVFLPLTFIDKEKLIRQNDILIVASTGSKKAIGRSGFVYGTHDNISIGAFLRICRLFYTKIFPYMTLIFSSEYYRNHIRESVQGTNINNVKKEYILNFLAPIPPLAEQRRIVAKLEELLPLCDQLAHQS